MVMETVALILGVGGLLAGLGLVFSGLVKNPIVKIGGAIFTILVLFSIWLGAVGLFPGIAAAIDGTTGISALAAPLTGIAVGSALGNLF